jgi:hypothetical protein
VNGDEETTTIIDCLIMLKAAYPRMEWAKDTAKDTMKVYEMALSDIDPALLKTAVLKHITTNKWFPTVAELRESAAAILAQASGLPSAYEAWGEVTRQMRLRGRWRAPELDPMTKRAVDVIGGWPFLCASENVTADRARFIEAYSQLAKRQQDDAMMLPAVREYTAQLADPEGWVNGQVAQLVAKLKDH